MNLLEDADPRRNAVRDFHPRKRHLDVDGLEMAPVKDRNVAVAVAELVRPVHDLQDLVRLRLAIVDLVEIGLVALFAANRPEHLLELVRRVAHDDVRDVEDAGDAPVVALELDDAAPVPAVRELHDVLDLRPAPRVDALEVVPDRHDVAVLRREDVRELRLKSVRVLVLVHEDVKEVLLQHFADTIIRLEELQAVHEEVVEVHRSELALAGVVGLGDLHDLLRREAGRLRLPAPRDEFDGLLLVHRLGDHLGDDLLLREVLRIVHRRLDDVAQELLLVVLVDDLEPRLIPKRTPVAPQKPRANRMERSRPNRLRRVPDHLLRPLQHLPRRAVGEREKKNPLRRYALFDQIRDTVHQCPRLARPRRREYQQGAPSRRRRRALLRIQQFRKISHDIKIPTRNRRTR